MFNALEITLEHLRNANYRLVKMIFNLRTGQLHKLLDSIKMVEERPGECNKEIVFNLLLLSNHKLS